jgi:hypothetical protein
VKQHACLPATELLHGQAWQGFAKIVQYCVVVVMQVRVDELAVAGRDCCVGDGLMASRRLQGGCCWRRLRSHFNIFSTIKKSKAGCNQAFIKAKHRSEQRNGKKTKFLLQFLTQRKGHTPRR